MTRLILQFYVIDIYLSNSCIVIQTYLNKNAPSSKMHKATSRIKAGVYGARKHGQRKKRWTSKILLLYFAVRPLFQPFVMFSTLPVLCVSVFWLRFPISCCSLEFLRMNYEYGWIMPLSPPLSSLAHTYISTVLHFHRLWHSPRASYFTWKDWFCKNTQPAPTHFCKIQREKEEMRCWEEWAWGLKGSKVFRGTVCSR